MKKTVRNRPYDPKNEGALVRKSDAQPLSKSESAGDDVVKAKLIRRFLVPGVLRWAQFAGDGVLSPEDAPAPWGQEPTEAAPEQSALLLSRNAVREAFGTDSDTAVQQMLCTLARGFDVSENRQALAGPVGALRAMGPKNTIEGMLMAQMLVMHSQVMRLLALSRQSNLNVDDVIRCLNAANSCGSAFRDGMESLTRFRASGKQQVIVSHVNIEPGAQAAFTVGGDVKGGGGGGGSDAKH